MRVGAHGASKIQSGATTPTDRGSDLPESSRALRTSSSRSTPRFGRCRAWSSWRGRLRRICYVWTRGFLNEIGYRVVMASPTRLMVDAKNVLTLVYNFESSKQTRHITRRELIVREREVEGHHAVTKVDTLENVADLLTKALDPAPFEKLRRLLLNVLAIGAIFPVPRARRIAAKRAAATRD